MNRLFPVDEFVFHVNVIVFLLFSSSLVDSCVREELGIKPFKLASRLSIFFSELQRFLQNSGIFMVERRKMAICKKGKVKML